jgi:hypothetical protein
MQPKDPYYRHLPQSSVGKDPSTPPADSGSNRRVTLRVTNDKT